MKKRILSLFVVLAMIIPAFTAVQAEDELPDIGEVIHGFKVIEENEDPIYNTHSVLFEHEKTGGKFLFVSNDDTQRAFDIAFRTPAYDSGISHVFEHVCISGSEKYPDNIFFNVAYQTLNSYMNAYTTMKHTFYPIASISDDQLLKLADYYLDGVFNPLIETGDAFRREGWRYELDSPESELKINGTVYSEMKGSINGSTDAYYNTIKTAFPGSNRAAILGGDPDIIPQMTNDDLIEYHNEYYRPSNALITLYGKADYEKYLELADEYFSEYDDTTADLSDNDYKKIDGHIEKTFTVHGNEDSTNYVYYAIPCETDDENEIFGLSMVSSMLNLYSSDFQQAMRTRFPETTVNVGFDMNLTEPLIFIAANNIDEDELEAFKETADSSLVKTATDGFSDELVDTFSAQLKRESLSSMELSNNIGIALIQGINTMWTSVDDEMGYFDYINYIADIDNTAAEGEYEALIDKFLVDPESSVLTLNIPDADMTEEKDAQLSQQLADVKASMTDDEINEIVRQTKEFSAADDSDNSELIEKINVSDVDMLRKEVENYKPKEYEFNTEKIGDAQLLTSEADISGIGMSRLYLDISQLSTEELLYFELYTSIMGSLPTENYTQQEIYSKIMRYISGSTKLLPADDTLYYTIDWLPLNEDTEETYNVIYEMLFNMKLEDADSISAIIERLIPLYEQSITASPESLLWQRVRAQDNKKASYYNYMEGLDFYYFLKSVRSQMQTDPQTVIDNLNKVKDTIRNSYNASVIFAGDKEGIELNRKYANEFFSKLENVPHGKADHDIPTPEGNEAIIIASDVNYNAVFAPLDKTGADRSGSMYVTQDIIYDKFLIPQLRHIQGAYGCLYALNEYGMGFISYRDPQLTETYNYYKELPDLIENSDITQDEVDKYILSTFSSHAYSTSSLEGAYDAMRQSIYNTERDTYEVLNEIINTTAEDVKNSADVYRKLAQDGIISTVGKESDIRANSDMFDTIIDPFGAAAISITIDGNTVKTDTDPIMRNGSVLVPMRAVFEEMGCSVEWDDSEKKVTVSKDGINVTVTIGANTMNVNGKEITLDIPAEIVNERTMIPVRAVSEALECNVDWNEDSNTVVITSR